jgi:hypothetical protein
MRRDEAAAMSSEAHTVAVAVAVAERVQVDLAEVAPN